LICIFNGLRLEKEEIEKILAEKNEEGEILKESMKQLTTEWEARETQISERILTLESENKKLSEDVETLQGNVQLEMYSQNSILLHRLLNACVAFKENV
jgi:hypothetical protein